MSTTPPPKTDRRVRPRGRLNHWKRNRGDPMSIAEKVFYWAGAVACVGLMVGVVAVVWVWAIDRLMSMCRVKWLFLQWAADYYAKRRAEERRKVRDSLAPRPLVDDAAGSCWCETCRPNTLTDSRMIVCPVCGNKRCPRATHHDNACAGSNEPGQRGSSWEGVAPAGGGTAADAEAGRGGKGEPR